jgi:hypothetical protein
VELADAIREALERQVLEHEPGQAALVLRDAVGDVGPETVARGLLDGAAVALRRMVAETDDVLDQDELLQRLAFDGAVPQENVELLGRMLGFAAATAGGVRPPFAPVLDELGPERALFGAWLGVLTVIRVVALSLGRTEAEITEDVVTALHTT